MAEEKREIKFAATAMTPEARAIAEEKQKTMTWVCYDTVQKKEMVYDYRRLVWLMDRRDRQVDLHLKTPVTDDVGYLTWDVEHWSCTGPRKYIRTYDLEGRVLRDYTMHNNYDLKNEFHPEDDNVDHITIS